MLGYALAFLSVTATLLVARLHFNLQAAPVSLFLCAIMFTAWIGGLRAGVVAALPEGTVEGENLEGGRKNQAGVRPPWSRLTLG